MKVKSLTLRSFRGIDNLTLNFDPKVTVLIGNNGVGKSGILDCLAMLLSQIAAKSFYNPVSLFDDNDINERANQTINKITITLRNYGDVTWSEVQFRAKEEEVGSPETSEQTELIELNKKIFAHELEVSNSSTVYYPSLREVVASNLEEVQRNIPLLSSHWDQIFNKKADFQELFRWFKKLEDLENELRLNDDSTYRDRQLEAVRKAIPEFLPGFSNLRVRRSPLRMTVQKQGQELIINQLSDGEKCLLAMVGDLARRLAIANPGLPDPLQGEGVVLIDEIELHLHPKWQREIIPALVRTFPNCQFIVTTHSPQILSHVKPDQIYSLESTPEGIRAIHPKYSYGRNSGSLLEDLMDVSARPQEIQNKLQELFRLISGDDIDKAKQKYEELVQEIRADDEELVRAQASIRRKEILSR
ncbi:AAA family ATPase [Phormidesmis sp. 146-35]